MNKAASAPSDYGGYASTEAEYGYDEGYGDGGGDYDDAAAPPPDAPAREARFERSAKRKSGGRFGRRRDAAASEAPAMAELASPAPGGGAGGETTTAEPEPAPAEPAAGAQKDPNDEPADAERHIIYTASMVLSVFNVDDAREKAEAIPDTVGGYVASVDPSRIVLRIPSGKLKTVMASIGGLGVVEHRSLVAQDVTDEYLDLETRIRVLEETQLQMMELLSKARTVQEALEVRKALDDITMELEVLKGQLRQMANRVAFSTLTLDLVERGPHTTAPSSNDPFPWVDSLGVEATEYK